MFKKTAGQLAALLIFYAVPVFGSPKYPVILVPGDGGSQLWQKTDSADEFTSLWMYPHDLVFHAETVLRHLTLHFDNRTGKTDDGANEEIRACRFGNPEVLTSLVTSWNPFPYPYPRLTEAECEGKVATPVVTDSDADGFANFRRAVLGRIARTDLTRKSQLLVDMWRRYSRHFPKSAPFRDPGCLSDRPDTLRRLRHSEVQMAMDGGSEGAVTGEDNLKFWNRSTDDWHREEDALQCIFDGLRIAWQDLTYYRSLVTKLKQHGYGNGSLWGAPYDFRKTPNELQDYYYRLTQLIENASAANDNVPVVVVAHSLGNLVMLHFYNQVTTQAWRDRYIRAHVALSPPWAGVAKALGLIISGDNFKLPFASVRQCRVAQRSWPSSVWLMPCVTCGLWDPTQPLVLTPGRNYTLGDYRQLFHDLRYRQGYDMWSWLQRLAPVELSSLPGLGELHVLYGTGVPTPSQVAFPEGAFPDGEAEVVYGDPGDGTVNLLSLEAFKLLPRPPGVNVTHTALPGIDHIAVLNDVRVLDFIVRLVTAGT